MRSFFHESVQYQQPPTQQASPIPQSIRHHLPPRIYIYPHSSHKHAMCSSTSQSNHPQAVGRGAGEALAVTRK